MAALYCVPILLPMREPWTALRAQSLQALITPRLWRIVI
jgi:hypothetical protein